MLSPSHQTFPEPSLSKPGQALLWVGRYYFERYHKVVGQSRVIVAFFFVSTLKTCPKAALGKVITTTKVTKSSTKHVEDGWIHHSGRDRHHSHRDLQEVALRVQVAAKDGHYYQIVGCSNPTRNIEYVLLFGCSIQESVIGLMIIPIFSIVIHPTLDRLRG